MYILIILLISSPTPYTYLAEISNLRRDVDAKWRSILCSQS